jgi:(1->4)-alpha-D-glucan 1-alpha-D-glucosylmutase
MKRIPCATYRLQFNRGFTFRHAHEILDYLRELGISDVYASPLFAAGPQSTHGYDTCCFGQLNPNLGSPEDFERLTNALNDRGLGLLLDLVPNHMSASLANPWWVDVLQNGRDSAYAEFFDIDWRPNNSALRGKVLLPVLEDHYGKVLESGKLRLTFQEGEYFISYHDRNFPVNRATVPAENSARPMALRERLSRTESSTSSPSRPRSAGEDWGKVALGIQVEGTNHPTTVLNELNGTPGDARSFDKLDALIQRQHYRLAYWKVAAEEINYRRFFDVTEMVAVKMEMPEVFRATHELVFEWMKAGKVTGLRIDHPDGLWDPKQYLERLQKQDRPYVVVEKILSDDERLPADWPVEGTTGYDFLNRANGLFVDSFNALAFTEIYREFTGNDSNFAEIVYRSRQRVLARSFGSELNSLTHRLVGLAARTRCGRDFTFAELHRALAEVIANFPVYRTYVTADSTGVSESDRQVIRSAVRAGSERAGGEVDGAGFEFIERLLLLELKDELDESGLKNAREFVMKFQQLTGPAMAKGLEDTAFYRFNRLISLNEVGSDPARFGVTPAEFHEANAAIARQWPYTLLASATHDTKRGEDARARLNVLSEMIFEWRDSVTRWARWNRPGKTTVEDSAAPDANDEYLLYQTLVGAWPTEGDAGAGLKIFRQRITAFMLKAVKEAKVHTSWTEPNAVYEKALQDFIERVLTEAGRNVFLEEIRHFSRRVAFFGRFNSLAQTLLKIASPGVPDFYQGGELWDLNLVDPDNRRPVDYAVRQKLLADLKKNFGGDAIEGGELFTDLLRDERPGAMKLFLIWRSLNFRGRQRELFDRGDYLPLTATGEKHQHVCAFARHWNDREIIVVVPRLVFGLMRGTETPPMGPEVWKDTALLLARSPAGSLYRNVLTRETVAVTEQRGSAALEAAQVLKSFPVALLEKI